GQLEREPMSASEDIINRLGGRQQLPDALGVIRFAGSFGQHAGQHIVWLVVYDPSGSLDARFGDRIEQRGGVRCASAAQQYLAGAQGEVLPVPKQPGTELRKGEADPLQRSGEFPRSGGPKRLVQSIFEGGEACHEVLAPFEEAAPQVDCLEKNANTVGW